MYIHIFQTARVVCVRRVGATAVSLGGYTRGKHGGGVGGGALSTVNTSPDRENARRMAPRRAPP